LYGLLFKQKKKKRGKKRKEKGKNVLDTKKVILKLIVVTRKRERVHSLYVHDMELYARL
jgi:hypothetical protein